MHNYNLQRGFQIVFIKGDGEFKPLEDLMIQLELYGGPKMNLASANKNMPEIERKIRVIKQLNPYLRSGRNKKTLTCTFWVGTYKWREPKTAENAYVCVFYLHRNRL